MPLVSIVIPCHNCERWLAAALDSALSQSHPDCEVLVVDDGSTDDSGRIAESFSDPRLTRLAQPRSGAASARNLGLRHARGEFIQFLDADDLLAPDKIARQLDALATQPQGAIASGPWGHFHESPGNARFVPESVWRDFKPVDWLVESWSGGGMLPPLAWLTPRAVLDRAGAWNEALSLNDDGEFFTRVLLEAAFVRFVPEARSFYRRHAGPRISSSRGRSAWVSAHDAATLTVTHLLAYENSARTRAASADLLQRVTHSMYPEAPDLVAALEKRITELGGSRLRCEGGTPFQVAQRFLGWKAAKRLQRCVSGWRAQPGSLFH